MFVVVVVPLQFALWRDPARLRPVAMAGSSAAFSSAAIPPQGTGALLPVFHFSSDADKATDRNYSLSLHKPFISLSCRQGMEKWSDLLLICLWLKQELGTMLNLCYLFQVTFAIQSSSGCERCLLKSETKQFDKIQLCHAKSHRHNFCLTCKRGSLLSSLLQKNMELEQMNFNTPCNLFFSHIWKSQK